MGFYHRRILPVLLDTMTTGPVLNALRKDVLVAARGKVLEVGFGTGINAAYYPPAVERVTGVDSNPGVERLARKRIDAAPVPMEFKLASGERLPFDDHAFDTVVTTLVLCSVSDVDVALAEIRRVLAPNGRYLVLEHGLADAANVQRWQRRLNPVNRALLGGCTLDRPTSDLVRRAGFQFEAVRQFYLQGAPRFSGFMTLGCAVPS